MAARQKTPENGMYHYVCWERRINHSEPKGSEKKKDRRPTTSEQKFFRCLILVVEEYHVRIRSPQQRHPVSALRKARVQ